ncbi:hypothetical protein C0J52_21729 [Blattella germanica]|nr:hypothetical protein C0J52_21729 [Blattella germanica]
MTEIYLYIYHCLIKVKSNYEIIALKLKHMSTRHDTIITSIYRRSDCKNLKIGLYMLPPICLIICQ